MLWQFRKDFLSLFTRGNEGGSYLDPIDGLRAIANLSILFLHLVTIFGAFVLPDPHIEWKEYLKSKAFTLLNLMSFTLELFFMLSGFLLTYKLITQWNKNDTNHQLFIRKEYLTSIVKRVLRFWPGMILATLVMFTFGEPQFPNSGYVFEFFRHLSYWMFFQNYIDLEYCYFTLGPLWTNSLDMQIHVILPFLLYLFYSFRKSISIYNSLVVLLIISIIRGIIVFDPIKISILSMLYRYPSFLLFCGSDHFLHWLETNYNTTFPFQVPKIDSGKLFMHTMYLPLEARFGSFIIGALLAIKLIDSSNHDKKPKTFKKFSFLGLICIYMFTLIQDPEFSPPPDIVLTLAMACSRQLFTISQAFILFTALCPSSHPYHSPWIKTFLSSRIWIPISKLSYFVYVIHWRISFELIFGGPLQFLKSYSVTNASLISLPIILIVTQFISCIWYILFEKPIERAIKYCCQKNQSSKTHLK